MCAIACRPLSLRTSADLPASSVRMTPRSTPSRPQIVRGAGESRPALQFESLLETMFALAEDGKTNKKGVPNPLRLAVIARAHFDTVRLPQPPAWLQRAGLAVGAPMGRLFGYGATYAPQAGTPALPAG